MLRRRLWRKRRRLALRMLSYGKKGREEEEEKKKEEEERKEKRLTFLLAVPDCPVNTSTIVHGIIDIASGSRDSDFVLSTIRGEARYKTTLVHFFFISIATLKIIK